MDKYDKISGSTVSSFIGYIYYYGISYIDNSTPTITRAE